MVSKKDELFEQIRMILEFFRKYWVWIIAAIVCLTTIGTLYAAVGVPEVYYSSARIYIRPYTGGQNYLSESFLVSEDLTKDGVEIAQSTPVLEEAIFNCHLQDMFTARSLREQMYAYADYQSRLMTVTVADVDAARVQALTDAVCQATIRKINSIMDGEWAVIMDNADLPAEPEYPVLHETIIQAAVFGLSVFFLIAVLYSMQEHRIRSGEDVKKYLDLELLGSIPKEDSLYSGGMMRNKKKRKGKNKFFKIISILLLILIIFIAGMLAVSKYGLTVTGYELDSEKIQNKFRIVQLTDLHNMEFGNRNRRLIEKIDELQPNLICMVGDMLNRDEESLTVVTDLISQLSEKYKVFFSLGNHETDYEENFSTDLKQPLEEAGAVVLNNEYQETEINGNKIYIGGISSYGLIEPSGDGSEYRFMKEFEQIDGFKLLMCHIPVGMLLWRGLEIWNMDLVLSGHEHGGQIILPGIGPLYSQDEGLFPTYTSGQYQISGHTLILSRGLGNSNRFVPRFNNIPEIVYADVY